VLSNVSFAIPIGIAQGKNPGRRIALNVYKYISIRGDHDVACTPNTVSE